MEIILFLLGMFSAFIMISFFKNILLVNAFVNAERQLLLISMSLLQYKYQAISLIEIVYDKAIESDEKYSLEKKQVIEKIHEKFNFFGDQWVESLKNNLPHEIKYNNWIEAVEYAEKLINRKR